MLGPTANRAANGMACGQAALDIGGEMRTLIVGGGVAGLTLAAKLHQQGREPVVVERQERYGEHGYSLGLYPFGSCVLHGLGVYDEWSAESSEIRRYEIANGKGEVVTGIGFDEFSREYEPMYDTTHADLVKTLKKACGDVEIRMGTTLRSLEQRSDAVTVTFSDDSSAEFDLVCGCDGIHSQTRELVFGEQPTFQTGWVGWTWWGEQVFPADLIREYWMAGSFFGTYPAPGKSTYVAALPIDQADPKANLPQDQLMARLRAVLGELTEHDPDVSRALAGANDLWPWPLMDVRAKELLKGRVILCGDAGIAFLPTAGLGASNALRSAAALADELSRADAKLAPLACELYVKRSEKIVRKNQEESRLLARGMFMRGSATSWARDELIKHMPARSATKQMVELMRSPL